MALDFNGTNQSIHLGTMDVPADTLAFTILLWVRPDTVTSNSDPRYVSKADGTGESNHWWMIGATSNGAKLRARMKFAGTTTTFAESGTSMVANEWQQVGLRWFGGPGATNNLNLLRNGAILSTHNASQAAISTDATKNVRIGSNGNGTTVNCFNGKIADVRIYTRYLSEEEISFIYNGGEILDGLYAWWPLQELGEPNTASGTDFIKDLMGVQHGTPSNSPTYYDDPPRLSDQHFFSHYEVPSGTNVSPGLFTNTPTFPAPTLALARTLEPGVFTNAPAFPSPTLTLARTVSPGPFTNEPQFPAPTISTGLEVAPATFTNTPQFPAPSLALAREVSPGAFANAPQFPAPTLQLARALSPGPFVNTPQFPSPTVEQGATVNPGTFVNATAFPSPTLQLARTLNPGAFVNAPQFPAPSVETGFAVSPGTFTNQPQFPAPTLQLQRTVAPGAFVNAPSFPPVTVVLARTVSPGVFVNAPGFPSPVVQLSKTVSPAAFVNVPAFPAPTVEADSGTISPGTFVNAPAFPSPTLLLSRTVAPGAFVVAPVFPAPEVFVGQIPSGLPSPVATSRMVTGSPFPRRAVGRLRRA